MSLVIVSKEVESAKDLFGQKVEVFNRVENKALAAVNLIESIANAAIARKGEFFDQYRDFECTVTINRPLHPLNPMTAEIKDTARKLCVKIDTTIFPGLHKLMSLDAAAREVKIVLSSICDKRAALPKAADRISEHLQKKYPNNAFLNRLLLNFQSTNVYSAERNNLRELQMKVEEIIEKVEHHSDRDDLLIGMKDQLMEIIRSDSPDLISGGVMKKQP